jgi:hypothetical protein
MLRKVENAFLNGVGQAFLKCMVDALFHRLANAFGQIESFEPAGGQVIMHVERLLDSCEKIFKREFLFVEHLNQGVDDLQGLHCVIAVDDNLLEFVFVFFLEVGGVEVDGLEPGEPVLLEEVDCLKLKAEVVVGVFIVGFGGDDLFESGFDEFDLVFEVFKGDRLGFGWFFGHGGVGVKSL